MARKFLGGTPTVDSTALVKTDDSRLSDARTPTAHKTSHATGGSDALAASDIGAVATSRTISTTAPLTGGGDLSANRTLAISDFTGDSGSGGGKGAVPAPASGDAAAGKFLKADGTWAAPTATVAVTTLIKWGLT